MADPLPGNTPEEYAQKDTFKEQLKPIVDLMHGAEGATQSLLQEANARFGGDAETLYGVALFSHDIRRHILDNVQEAKLARTNLPIPNYIGNHDVHDLIVSQLADPQGQILEVPSNLGPKNQTLTYTPTRLSPLLYIQTETPRPDPTRPDGGPRLPGSSIVGRDPYIEGLLAQSQQQAPRK